MLVTQAPEATWPEYFLLGLLPDFNQIGQPGDSGMPCMLLGANQHRYKIAGVSVAGDFLTWARVVSPHIFRDWANGIIGAAPSLGDHAGFERSDLVDAIIYRNGSSNRQLSNPNGSWKRFTLPGGTVASNPAVYVYPDGATAVTYRDTSNKLRETYFYPGGGWNDHSISDAVSGEPSAAGDPAAYIRSDATGVVLYRSTANRIQEISWPDGATSWTWTDLSNTPLATLAASDPVGYVRHDGANAVVYRDNAGAVCELCVRFPARLGPSASSPAPHRMG
jgi:hypothetical protein